MIFLENPAGGKRMAKGRRRDGRIRKGYKLTAGGRVVPVGRKSGRKRSTRRNPVARKKGTRRRRRARRNPPIIRRLTDGTVGALQVLTGKAVARSVPGVVGLPTDGATGIATQAAVAIFAATIAERFLSSRAASFVLAGALTAPLESAIVAANVPFLSQALQGEPLPAMSAYPMATAIPGVDYQALDAYPHDVTMGEYEYGQLLNYG